MGRAIILQSHINNCGENDEEFNVVYLLDTEVEALTGHK